MELMTSLTHHSKALSGLTLPIMLNAITRPAPHTNASRNEKYALFLPRADRTQRRRHLQSNEARDGNKPDARDDRGSQKHTERCQQDFALQLLVHSGLPSIDREENGVLASWFRR